MDTADLNLLLALDALLAESSVTGAARRLGLSASATSRALTRLRATTGDPLLVRAGRGLVPTPHATALRDRVHALTREAKTVLQPPTDPFDVASLRQTFTIRASEAFVARFSVPLLTAVTTAAPHVRLRFAHRPDKDAEPLREGSIDLEIGVVEPPAAEMHTRLLFRDAFVGVVREGHPLLHPPGVTPERYAVCDHVVASRKASVSGPVDDALKTLGLERGIRAVVPGFPDALRIARHSDLVALVTRSCLDHTPPRDHVVEPGLQAFALPVQTPALAISAMWHPRVDTDPAHRWFRDTVFATCGNRIPASGDKRH